MARYRKVDVRIWGDSTFRRLSPLRPSGQALWIILLIGKQTKLIPGLCSIGFNAFAEQLKWSSEDFDSAWTEVAGHDLARADWHAQVVWVPNAIRYNEPRNPNIVTGWAAEWDEIPECKLKKDAHKVLSVYMESRGKSFADAFERACPEPRIVDFDDESDWFLVDESMKAFKQVPGGLSSFQLSNNEELKIPRTRVNSLINPVPDPDPDLANDSLNDSLNDSSNDS